ncbi:MAG: M13 family metallopeptidase, partial [Chloroflexota bacterium]|nr:M13 family metallopeptidase [Chloroflexota bacterium]
DADTVMRMETRLATASMTRVDQRDPDRVYNPRTRADLRAQAPGLDWDTYLDALGTREDGVNARQPEFLRECACMAADTPAEEWRTYLRWHLANARAEYLPKAFEDADFDFFHRYLQGVPEQQPRWKRVLDVVDQRIGEALGQLYVERAFPPEAKEKVLDLVEDLRAALGERIRGLEWMTGPTKEQALRKLAAFRVKMGYPDQWRDYSDLEIDRTYPYAANVAAADAFEMRRILSKLGNPVDRDEWRMSPPTVNAYYMSSYNEIVFPAGILQPPLFDPDADDAVNYGAIGMVIGHEMTHGFDDSGSKFDWDGNLTEWWTAEDRAEYTHRTDRVVRQFDAYEPIPGEAVNGRLTLGENIADLGGIKIAFAAFQRSARSRAHDIDGFTPEQRFFLGCAQGWRSVLRDEAMRVRLATDPHSPAEFRVNGPLSNLPEFFDAFGCESGSAMKRGEEVRPSIW